MDNSLIRTRIEIAVLFALYLFLLPKSYMQLDMDYWREWALIIHRNGLAHAYISSINYFPVYIYGLYIYDLLQGTEANIVQHINSIKILFVCFDFLPVVVLCAFRQKLLTFKIPHLYLLLNIAYVFNSMMWGQIDSIYTNLALLAIIITLHYPVWGILLYLLALNTKQQAIEFLPVMFVAAVYSIRNTGTIIKVVAAVAVLQVIILLPFLGSGGMGKMAGIVTNTVGLYHNLSICAFNIWYLITTSNPYFINASDKWIVLSYTAIGLIMFAITTMAVFMPLLKRIWQLRKNRLAIDIVTWHRIFLGTGLICLYFFYFNSQMHERYAHPIIIFFFFYGAAAKNYKLYILASIPYFLSLDKCFPDYLPIVHYKIIYASKIIAIWYTVTVIYGSYLYYKLVTEPPINQLTN
ncbi:MAG: hypothetical protein JWQ38_3290 [Flavipsychrobacter sp.]|nr:hypothetical protein [Flavipsychrobacter sp.]